MPATGGEPNNSDENVRWLVRMLHPWNRVNCPNYPKGVQCRLSGALVKFIGGLAVVLAPLRLTALG